MDSLSHTNQAESGSKSSTLDVEADTVVVYFERKIVVRSSQLHCDILSAAVFNDVMQRLLRHPQKDKRDHIVQFLLDPSTRTMNRDTKLLRALAALTLNRDGKAQELQL